MVPITIVTGAYKPTYNWGAPHCMGLFYPHYPGAGSIALEVRGACLGRGRGARSACCARCARCALGQVLFHALPRTFFKVGHLYRKLLNHRVFGKIMKEHGWFRVYTEYIYILYL